MRLAVFKWLGNEMNVCKTNERRKEREKKVVRRKMKN